MFDNGKLKRKLDIALTSFEAKVTLDQEAHTQDALFSVLRTGAEAVAYDVKIGKLIYNQIDRAIYNSVKAVTDAIPQFVVVGTAKGSDLFCQVRSAACLNYAIAQEVDGTFHIIGEALSE